MQTRFLADIEPLLGTLAKLFAAEGAAREVAVLTYSTPEVVDTHYDNWNGGTTSYMLLLHVTVKFYPQLQENLEKIQQAILDKIQVFLTKYPNDNLTEVKIVPAVVEDPQWREKAAAWLSGEKISNQGRVRSDNVAPLLVDGLLFRSNPEIHLYRAFKAAGISFAPLAVFVRGGNDYRRIEPDFFVVHSGVSMVVEVDGDTVHQESPAEAHDRTTMLLHEGVRVERIKSSECDTPEKAKHSADRIIGIIEKLRATKVIAKSLTAKKKG